MSAKKKPFSSCEKCGCYVIAKDAPRHPEFCGKSIESWQIPLVRPKVAIKGFTCSIEKVYEYLPPDAVGWTRAHSVLINPQTLELLLAFAGQPVRLSFRDEVLIGTLWPCKEVGAMKIAVVDKHRSWPRDQLCIAELIHETKSVDRVFVSISDPECRNVPFQEYLESYLSNCFFEPNVPIFLNYYGKKIIVTPHSSANLENAMQDMSLNEGEILTTVYKLTMNGLVVVSDLEDGSETVQEHKLEDIAGMESVKKMFNDFIVSPYLSEGRACSLLLWGLPGSGKTWILKKLVAILKEAAFYTESMDDFEERSSLIPSGAIVIADWPSFEKDHKAFPKFQQLLNSNRPTAVILSVRKADDVDIGIRVRFPVEVEVSVPTEAERLEILQFLTKANATSEFSELAKRTHGFTAGDLKSLVSASQFCPGKSLRDRLESARRFIRPTGIRQFVLEVPDVTWADIGGNEDLKLEIQQAVIWPQLHKDVFERFGIDAPSGILLYGPPGCSKTLVARALANESKMNFLAVKGPELFSKWVGESERAIRELFARARQVAPTIVFFDEIDAVGASRGSEKSSGVSDRVLAQLLTELDGLEKSSGVILLAATNRPDQLDSALLRPGRLDRSIHVGLPSPSTRRAVLTMRLRKTQLADDVSIDSLVDKTNGYSGAELVALCRTAALIAMREDLTATSVQWHHFEKALQAVVPRTEQYLLDIYHQFQMGCIS